MELHGEIDWKENTWLNILPTLSLGTPPSTGTTALDVHTRELFPGTLSTNQMTFHRVT